jgi:hypothetical protein
MDTDKKKFCADLIFSDAVQDMAQNEYISISEARTRLISSVAYKALYDYETNLWQEGPDYLLDFYYKTIEKSS